MNLSFYNTLKHEQQQFVSITPGQAGLYTCGPTVYNYAHIGNFRAYVFEDLLRRTLKLAGYKVTQVMNLTDVDDKTISGCRESGQALGEFTARYKDAFFADLKTLRVEAAEFYPAATDHIPEMIALVQTLMDKGFAYKADDGSVYFSIAKFPSYGQLVKLRPEDLRPGDRVNHDEYAKESVADFALWKARVPEDGEVWWDSPWGQGRPGWHIECSAMSMKYLGRTFDIHTGGVDNCFPHHEDEIAQSEAANGCRFVNYWLHCAHLIVDGDKMSKSLGNFYTLRDLLERGFSGRELRWVLLSTHYRQKLNFSFDSCLDARAALQRLDDFRGRVSDAADAGEAGIAEAEDVCAGQLRKFQDALADDLNISAALAAVFDLVRNINKLIDASTFSGRAAEKTLAVLGVFDQVLGVFDLDAAELSAPVAVQALAEERQQARKAKDFARADAIRAELLELGWVIEDTPKGMRLKRKN